jgi:hypothetical protein
MVVGTPHKLDDVANRGVHRERYIAENTLGRRNDDSVGSARSRTAVTARRSLRGGRVPWLRRVAILCHTFCVGVLVTGNLINSEPVLTGDAITVA